MQESLLEDINDFFIDLESDGFEFKISEDYYPPTSSNIKDLGRINICISKVKYRGVYKRYYDIYNCGQTFTSEEYENIFPLIEEFIERIEGDLEYSQFHFKAERFYINSIATTILESDSIIDPEKLHKAFERNPNLRFSNIVIMFRKIVPNIHMLNYLKYIHPDEKVRSNAGKQLEINDKRIRKFNEDWILPISDRNGNCTTLKKREWNRMEEDLNFKEFFKSNKQKTKEKFLNLFEIDASDIDEIMWDIRDEMEITNTRYEITSNNAGTSDLIIGKDSKFSMLINPPWGARRRRTDDGYDTFHSKNSLDIIFSDAYENRQTQKYLFNFYISFIMKCRNEDLEKNKFEISEVMERINDIVQFHTTDMSIESDFAVRRQIYWWRHGVQHNQAMQGDVINHRISMNFYLFK